MAHFKRKQGVIEAWPAQQLLYSAAHNWKALPKQINDAYEAGNILFGYGKILISTVKGNLIVGQEEWVICGAKGELYSCDRETFADNYEPVELNAI